MKGPKPERAVSSVEKLTIVVVRPWKLPDATTIVARSAADALDLVTPTCGPTLTALSTASAPVFIAAPCRCAVSAARDSANFGQLIVV